MPRWYRRLAIDADVDLLNRFSELALGLHCVFLIFLRSVIFTTCDSAHIKGKKTTWRTQWLVAMWQMTEPASQEGR